MNVAQTHSRIVDFASLLNSIITPENYTSVVIRQVESVHANAHPRRA
jgi:site-specific recombinase XerD